MVVVVDDENRENEGDLIFCGSNVSSEKINFMAKYARGLICLALDKKKFKKLKLKLMTDSNQSKHRTAFTVSIEAKKELLLELALRIDLIQSRLLSRLNANQMILLVLDIFFLY